MESIVAYISYGLIPLVLIYVHRILFFRRGLHRLHRGTNRNTETVTVIVPARNEEHTITRCLRSLDAQEYPIDRISIIVVDDHSTDNTKTAAASFAKTSRVPIVVIKADEFADIQSPKIRALSHGIQNSPATIILTTDADCTVHPQWVRAIVSNFEEHVGVVTGLTVFEKTPTVRPLFWGIQFLDFISYTSIAAGAIGMDRVLIANGSNMAFRREAFDDTGGFAALHNINTGDDSLLAQKIVSTKKWKARFAIEESATVTTQPAKDVNEMFHQRLRWVGQTAYYPPYMMVFMICTFLLFIGLTIVLPLTIVFWNIVPWIVLTVKFGIDFITMSRFTRVTKTHSAMKYFIPTAFIHIPFILVSTVGGYFFSFEWKDRKLKKESGI